MLGEGLPWGEGPIPALVVLCRQCLCRVVHPTPLSPLPAPGHVWWHWPASLQAGACFQILRGNLLLKQRTVADSTGIISRKRSAPMLLGGGDGGICLTVESGCRALVIPVCLWQLDFCLFCERSALIVKCQPQCAGAPLSLTTSYA